jgi:16S rRNA (guanine1207-N2)-methyltransferase
MTPASSSGQVQRDYATPRRLELAVGGQVIPVISKPGLPDWERLTPAASLLAEHARIPPEAKALLLGSGHGAAAVSLAQRLPRGELWIMDNSAIALEMSALTLQANQVQNASILNETSLPEREYGAFDAVLIELPKGHKLARRWLAQAWSALRPGGAFYLAGANDLGIGPALKDAASLFGTAAILDYMKGNRIARFTRPVEPPSPPTWLHEKGIEPGTWFELDARTPAGLLRLCSLPGVFSYDRVDDASRLLLEQIRLSAADRVLDIGCGYGLLGLAAARMGAALVDLVDVNLLAVAAARENIRRLGLGNARALPSDVLSAVIGRTYTLILTNPPFHAGKGVDYQIAAAFIRQSWAALEPGGRLLLVANRFIRYEKMMEGLFSRIEVAAQDNRYHVLAAMK